MSAQRPIRVLIAKPGLDGHDKGAKIVARGLKDAGMEVIYTGLRQTVDSIIRTAIQEDADVIGLSILSGSHLSICRDLMAQLADEDVHDKVVVVGGVIPKKDVGRLQEMGVGGVFGVKSTLHDISTFIRSEVEKTRESES